VIDKVTKRPINGAKIVVERKVVRSGQWELIEETRHRADLNGRYRFVIRPEHIAMPGLLIATTAEHPDYVLNAFGTDLRGIHENLKFGDPSPFSRIELSPAETIAGRIVDPDRRPLGGIRIWAYSKTNEEDDSEVGSFFDSETNEEGRFTLGMVKGGSSVFWIVPKNFAPQQVVPEPKQNDCGDIQVHRGSPVSGLVLNATGEPVAGVWVNIYDEAAQRELAINVESAVVRSAETDENGKFRSGPLMPSTYRISVGDAPREMDYYKRVRQPIEIRDVFVPQNIVIDRREAERPITIQAVPHIRFVGQCLDSKGEPYPGWNPSLIMQGNLGGQWYSATLHPDSEGKIAGRLPKGLEQARLYAVTNEHGAIRVRLKKDGPLLDPRNVGLGEVEDDITGIEIIGYKAAVVQIKAVDESGQQISEFEVAGLYEGDGRSSHTAGGLTTHIWFNKQTDGRYRTSQLLPDSKITFTARADGHQDASETISLPEGAEKEITLTMKRKPKENAQ